MARNLTALVRGADWLVALRGLVAALLVLHVGLIAPELSDAGLLAVAVAACAVMCASAVVALIAARRLDRRDWRRMATATIAAVDALALVTIARLTIDVDPTASIVWAFVLWVPFSLAISWRATPALVGAGLVALLVLAASLVAPGPLDRMPRDWTTLGVPALLVFVGGLTTVLTSTGQRRRNVRAYQQLVLERDRSTRLAEADELKNTFLSAVSHELRSPLTSILGFALTLLDRQEELDPAMRERMLRTIVLEAEHVEDILSNLLDLDRLTRGKATLAPTELDPEEVVREAVEHVQRRNGRRVDLQLEHGVHACLDGAKVERIVENLVGNAIKFTPRDAPIIVAMERDRDGVRIRVDDSGPGVDPELRDVIFQPFRRASSDSVPGTGIGLSLVDRFSRMHGGRAWVEDRPGGGARFQVYLPSVTWHESDSTSSVSSRHGASTRTSMATGPRRGSHAAAPAASPDR